MAHQEPLKARIQVRLETILAGERVAITLEATPGDWLPVPAGAKEPPLASLEGEVALEVRTREGGEPVAVLLNGQQHAVPAALINPPREKPALPEYTLRVARRELELLLAFLGERNRALLAGRGHRHARLDLPLSFGAVSREGREALAGDEDDVAGIARVAAAVGALYSGLALDAHLRHEPVPVTPEQAEIIKMLRESAASSKRRREQGEEEGES